MIKQCGTEKLGRGMAIHTPVVEHEAMHGMYRRYERAWREVKIKIDVSCLIFSLLFHLVQSVNRE